MNTSSGLTPGCLALAVCHVLIAGDYLTDPAFRNSALINSHSSISIRARTILGIEASFANLGKIDYPVDESSNEDLVEYYFNDGYINLNDESSTLTSDFSFTMNNAVQNTEGLVQSFTLSRYRSTTSDEIFQEDPETSIGWEFAYQYEWGSRRNKLRLGMITGLAINDLNFNTNQQINSQLYIQTAQITFDTPSITYVADETYYGTTEGPMIDLASELNMDLANETLVNQDVWGQGPVSIPAEVSSMVRLDGVLANLRLGPTLDYSFSDRLQFQGGIGLCCTYFSCNVAVSETLENTLLENSYSEYDTFSTGDWLPGYYVEGSVQYRLNERTSVYSSLQMQNVSTPATGDVEDVEYNVNLQNKLVLSMGLNLAF